MNDCDYENGAVYDYEYRSVDYRDSDEDTEDASETGSVKHEYMDDYEPRENLEIKEQMYRDQLAQLRSHLEQLDNDCHPDFVKGLAILDRIFDDRRLYIECCFNWQKERIEHDFQAEEQSAIQEFNDRRNELKENLIADLEEKKRMFEADSLELSSDTTEPKPATTRKLRRRPNDPIPMPDRRRRASPAHINYMLDDGEINEDLKLIAKYASNLTKSISSSKSGNAITSRNQDYDACYSDARIEDNKLFYDKKWFHRGQNIFLESSDGSKANALILQIVNNEVYVRKTGENIKTKITLSDLHLKKFIIQRRS